MNEDNQNPYQAPESDIETNTNSGELLGVPNSVTAGRGFSWLESSVSKTLAPSLGGWMLIGLIYLLILFALNIIPIVNIIAPTLLGPVFTAGLILGANKVYNGESLSVGTLFEGFSVPKSSHLFLFGLFSFIVTVVLVIGAFAFIGFDFLATAMSGGTPDAATIQSMAGKMFMMIPIGIIIGILFMLALWFPPALIALHDMSVIDAFKTGFSGAIKNISAIIVLILMLIVLSIVVGIIFLIIVTVFGIISQWLAFGVAFLVGLPVALLGAAFWAGVTYHAYRDIFLAQE